MPDWPPGLVLHAAGAVTSGWMAFDVWEPIDAHPVFTDDRLAPAFQAVGCPGPPNRVEWIDLAATCALAGS